MASKLRTAEQLSSVSSLKYIFNAALMSSRATLDAALELFQSDLLCHPSCLKLQVSYVHNREILISMGTVADKSRGLYLQKAIVNKLFESDKRLCSETSTIIAELKLASSWSNNSSATYVATSQPASSDVEFFWSRVDNTNEWFPEYQRYSSFLIESPNLQEVRKAYNTYCNQKDFLCADRVRLVSSIPKGQHSTFGSKNWWMRRILGAWCGL